jgi:hypothetical protein
MVAANPGDPALDFTKHLYSNIIDWYKDVHSRAQQVLTLNGAFVSLLGAAILLKGADLSDVKGHFGWDTYVALAVMAVLFAGSGICAVAALMPLGLGRKRIGTTFEEFVRKDGNRNPAPSVMWWSQFIALQGRLKFVKRAARMTPTLHQEALASQIQILSKRLSYKYRFISAAFVLTAAALLALLWATVSYFANVPAGS